MNRRPDFLPETRQFSQADARVQQRPEGIDALDAEGVLPEDIEQRNLKRYSEMQATPGRWDEAFPFTTLPQNVEYGRGILLEKDLGFQANSFLVDNWTNQWLYEPNLKRFIPPYSGAWVFPIANAFQKARIELRAPGAFTLAAALAGEFVWCGWHEAMLPPATGILLGGSVAPSGAAEVVITDDNGVELLLTPANGDNNFPFSNGVPTASFNEVYSGANWDRLRSASAANLGGQSGLGAALIDTPGEWSITSTPAANTQASVTKAAAGATRHIARVFTGDFVAGAVAPGAAVATLNLRDGASGAGTILLSRYLAVQAVAGDKDDTQVGPVNVPGTLNTAMTIEFAAAGGANTLQAVGLTGFDAT